MWNDVLNAAYVEGGLLLGSCVLLGLLLTRLPWWSRPKAAQPLSLPESPARRRQTTAETPGSSERWSVDDEAQPRTGESSADLSSTDVDDPDDADAGRSEAWNALQKPSPPLHTRIERRMELLDGLIVEADREIEQLSDLLADVRSQWPESPARSMDESVHEQSAATVLGDFKSARRFSNQQKCMIRLLWEHEYALNEIADLIGSRDADVAAILSGDQDGGDQDGFDQRRAG